MEVQESFEEWEEEDWAEFIKEAAEDGEIAVQSEEDCIDSESDSGNEGNVVIKCSKCKNLRAWLKNTKNLANEKGLKTVEKLGCLNISRKPGRCCLPSDVRNFSVKSAYRV